MGKFLTAREQNILNVGLLVSYPVLPGIYLYQMRKSQYEMKMMAQKKRHFVDSVFKESTDTILMFPTLNSRQCIRYQYFFLNDPRTLCKRAALRVTEIIIFF